jgi:hypothetical protein
MPCHAMHPMQDLFLESFFTSTIILYILLFAQNFYSCKKWVLHLNNHNYFKHDIIDHGYMPSFWLPRHWHKGLP